MMETRQKFVTVRSPDMLWINTYAITSMKQIMIWKCKSYVCFLYINLQSFPSTVYYFSYINIIIALYEVGYHGIWPHLPLVFRILPAVWGQLSSCQCGNFRFHELSRPTICNISPGLWGGTNSQWWWILSRLSYLGTRRRFQPTSVQSSEGFTKIVCEMEQLF